MSVYDFLETGSMIDQTLAQAPGLLDHFKSIAAALPELRRGIRKSEGFFIYATIGPDFKGQIVESGRALGQSTELLARSYPDARIVSIEREVGTPDAIEALSRLKSVGNIACLFGDSRVLLPELTLPGDVVVIDGPKNIRAVKLGLEVIARKKPRAVFIHDCRRGSFTRQFLDSHYAGRVFFSDEPQFVALSCQMDTHLPAQELAQWSTLEAQPRDRSYGGTFACLMGEAIKPGFKDALYLRLARWKQMLKHED